MGKRVPDGVCALDRVCVCARVGQLAASLWLHRTGPTCLGHRAWASLTHPAWKGPSPRQAKPTRPGAVQCLRFLDGGSPSGRAWQGQGPSRAQA